MVSPALTRGSGLLGDLVVSGSVAALSTWWWHQYRLGGLLFGVLAGLVLMWRRHRPITVLVLVAVLTAVTATIEVNGTKLHDGMLLITVATAMYAVIVHSSTLLRAAVAGLGGWLFASLLLPLQNNSSAGWSRFSLEELTRGSGILLGYGAVVWAMALSVRYFGQLNLNTSERRQSAERERRHVAQIA